MRPHLRPHPVGRAAARSAALVLALCGACADDTDEVIGTDVAHVAPTVTCTPGGGAQVAGNSPEGDLWLRTGATTAVLTADGARQDPTWRIDDATALAPTSATAAAAIVDGEVWTFDDGSREWVPTPGGAGAAAALCGWPTADHGTFVATAGGLIERAAGLWWQWSPSTADGFGALGRLARIDGACSAADDAVWLTNASGALWRITRDRAEVVAGAQVPVDEVAIVPALGAAVRSGDELTVGPPFHQVRFDAGPVAHVASGGDRLWVVAGGATFLRSGDAWAQVDGLSAAPTRIWPDAGGAWLEIGSDLCRATLVPTLHVTGLAPFEQRTAPLAQLRVVPPADTTTVTVERDGAQVGTAAVREGVAALGDVDLGAGGWHQLTIRAGTTSRLLEYNLLQISDRSWDADVRPIFEASCGGTRCHGPAPSGGRVDLSTYDGWRTKASRIRERLLRGEMPPSGPRLDGATVDIVLDWIEGGMRP